MSLTRRPVKAQPRLGSLTNVVVRSQRPIQLVNDGANMRSSSRDAQRRMKGRKSRQRPSSGSISSGHWPELDQKIASLGLRLCRLCYRHTARRGVHGLLSGCKGIKTQEIKDTESWIRHGGEGDVFLESAIHEATYPETRTSRSLGEAQ